MKIYIDHFRSQEQKDLIDKISNRLKGIDNSIEVVSYEDLYQDRKNNDPQDKTEKQAKSILESLRNADVIIPVITPDYLSKNGEAVNKVLLEASEDNNKTIFPFIYGNANWASVSWIVKSKVFPSDGNYSSLTIPEQEELINDLVTTIGNIFSQEEKIKKIEKEKVEENETEKLQETEPIESTDQVDEVHKEVEEVKKQIFISHSHTDADFAELLKLYLEKENIESWVDADKLKIGQDWREEIDLGISSSTAVIAIMSPEARKSEYVTYEWAYAWGKGIPIFPIMLLQTPLHPRLESLQYLDFTNRATRPYDELIKRIKGITP